MVQPTATPSASPSAAASTTSATYVNTTGNAGRRAPTLLPGFETVSDVVAVSGSNRRGIEQSAVTRELLRCRGAALR